MKTLQLPNTDLTVSQLCFGCWGITSDFHWGDRDDDALHGRASRTLLRLLNGFPRPERAENVIQEFGIKLLATEARAFVLLAQFPQGHS